ncbi:MAG: sulfatase-like hydrolase/transferase, partial [Bryobacterales bacterium]|nr:sulfatase-like hydrolase/transferase [Bryobacterales bacterium]
MDRRTFLGTAMGATLASAQQAKRPNILYVFADQLRAHSMGCYGNAEVKTPNLDRLAAEGILFEYTFANTP